MIQLINSLPRPIVKYMIANRVFSLFRKQQPLKSSTLSLVLLITMITVGYEVSPTTSPTSHLDLIGLSTKQAHAKPKKRRRKRYDRRQREAKKLIEAGHPTVELTLKTDPRVRASVYHGKELLGSTPLRLVWPKDTGSLDIKLKAKGYLTVNSRLYTHRNDRVTVKMFKTDQAHLLFGYKKKVKSELEESEKPKE